MSIREKRRLEQYKKVAGLEDADDKKLDDVDAELDDELEEAKSEEEHIVDDADAKKDDEEETEKTDEEKKQDDEDAKKDDVVEELTDKGDEKEHTDDVTVDKDALDIVEENSSDEELDDLDISYTDEESEDEYVLDHGPEDEDDVEGADVTVDSADTTSVTLDEGEEAVDVLSTEKAQEEVAPLPADVPSDEVAVDETDAATIAAQVDYDNIPSPEGVEVTEDDVLSSDDYLSMVEADNEQLSEYDSTIAGLESLYNDVKSTLNPDGEYGGRGMDAMSCNFARRASDAYLSKHGKSSGVPGVESYGIGNGRMVNTTAALEALDDRIKELIDQGIAWIKKIYEDGKKWFMSFFDEIESGKKKLAKLKALLESNKDVDFKANAMVPIGNVRLLSCTTTVDDFKDTLDLLKELFGSFHSEKMKAINEFLTAADKGEDVEVKYPTLSFPDKSESGDALSTVLFGNYRIEASDNTHDYKVYADKPRIKNVEVSSDSFKDGKKISLKMHKKDMIERFVKEAEEFYSLLAENKAKLDELVEVKKTVLNTYTKLKSSTSDDSEKLRDINAEMRRIAKTVDSPTVRLVNVTASSINTLTQFYLSASTKLFKEVEESK